MRCLDGTTIVVADRLMNFPEGWGTRTRVECRVAEAGREKNGRAAEMRNYASPTLPRRDDSPRWLSPPHVPLSGVRSGQRAQTPVATAACADVATGAIGYTDTRHEGVEVW